LTTSTANFVGNPWRSITALLIPSNCIKKQAIQFQDPFAPFCLRPI
jgi:hypothetical protein